MKTVIIGGVAGGATAAARLRRLDEKAEIVILEKGQYISFANCGLPYYLSQTINSKENLILQTPESFKSRFNITVKILSEAIKIDTKAKSVEVKDLQTGEIYQENYDNLIISTGTKLSSINKKIDGINNDFVFSVRSISDVLNIMSYINDYSPKSACIVGGGYIGIEVAENLLKRGLSVNIIEYYNHIIQSLDFDMAMEVESYINSKGINLYLNTEVTRIKDKKVLVKDLNSTLESEIDADIVILCTGVEPETDIAKNCGIKINKRGNIIVNSQMQTNIPNIYAVGDAIEVQHFVSHNPTFIPLAGPANKQGRIAADNICGFDSQYQGTQGTSIIKFFDMTIATTGLSETTAKSLNFDYDKTYIYQPSHATYYPGSSNMSIKAIWDKKTLKLLGAQIVGYDGVDKRIDVIATAIRFEAKVTDLANLELAYAPPFGSAKDPVSMLGFVAQNIITGKIKQFFWNDVKNLPRDGSVSLIDVRTPLEFSIGHIDGFKNIPLDDLRTRINEIPRDKPVYVHCHSGLTSYIACRILVGNGYNCYNLAGGWRLYRICNK